MSLLFMCLALLDSRGQAEEDRWVTPPSIVGIAIRLPFLKKGMDQKQAEKLLGIDDFLLGYGGGTFHTQSRSIPARPKMWLTLVYFLDPKSGSFTYVLEEAELTRER